MEWILGVVVAIAIVVGMGKLGERADNGIDWERKGVGRDQDM